MPDHIISRRSNSFIGDRLYVNLFATSSTAFNLFVSGTSNFNGNTTVTGSLIVTQGITGSLLGTASFATSALSASFATTAISASFASTASFVANDIITASVSSNTITFTKGDGTTFPITVATGSGAGGTVTSVGGQGTVSGITLTGTVTSSGSLTLGGSISGLTNSNLSGTAGITNANLANSSITVGSTSISLGGTATTITGLTSVTSTAFTGSLLGTASFATSALSSSFATTASFASNGISGLTSNFIPKATSATTLGNSIIQDTGTKIGISGSLEVTGSLIVSSSGAQVYGNLQAFSDVIVDGTTVWQGKAVMGSLTPPKGGMVSYVKETDLLAYTGGQWTGEVIGGTAGATVTAGQLCYLNSTDLWRTANADNLSESTTLLGICLLTATATNPTFMLLKGFVKTTYSLGSTSGEPLYIEPGTGAGNGYVNPVVPTAPGQIVRIIGHTHNSTTIRFNPDNIWVEL